MRVETLDEQAGLCPQLFQVADTMQDMGEIIMHLGYDQNFLKHGVLLSTDAVSSCRASSRDYLRQRCTEQQCLSTYIVTDSRNRDDRSVVLRIVIADRRDSDRKLPSGHRKNNLWNFTQGTVSHGHMIPLHILLV